MYHSRRDSDRGRILLCWNSEKEDKGTMGDLSNIILFITYDDRQIRYVLPGINDRQYTLDLEPYTQVKGMILPLEVWDGTWYLVNHSDVRISLNHQIIHEEELKAGRVFGAKINKSGKHFQVRVAGFGSDQTEYSKYALGPDTQVEIGKDPSCVVILDDTRISRVHAILFPRGGRWYIEDRSRNGTYLNGSRFSEAREVQYGDVISVMDYQLLFLGNVLAVNGVSKVRSRLAYAKKKDIAQKRIWQKNDWFTRMPRFMEPFDEEEIEIEQPPQLSKSKKQPIFLAIGPSLTMPIPILLMVLFNIAAASMRGGSSSPVMYFGMAISVIMFGALGVMWTILRRNYEETSEAETQQERETAYMNYISQNESLLSQKSQWNRRILEHLYISSSDLIRSLSADASGLWNRNVNHRDFLMVRIGEGSMKLPNPIRIPKQRFSIENDPLMSLPHDVKEKYETMEGTPKIMDLKREKIIGIVGEDKFMMEFGTSLILQITALHSYVDVKTAFLLKPGAWDKEWRFVKWLPHTFTDQKRARLIADNEESFDCLTADLMSLIKFREDNLRDQNRDHVSFQERYLVFVTDRERFLHSPIYQYMISDKDYGITFLLFFGELSNLPNECKCIIEDTKTFQGAYHLDQAIDKGNRVRFEGITSRQAEPFIRTMCRHVLQEMGQAELPQYLDYLSMIGIGRVEQWDLLKHYKENRSFEGIRARLGVMTGDKDMYLDIHEKKHGPHGLIAGTTGSGKSELIQTFILSLALNYHPSEVAFILIDYKGGGMAKIFEGMPHIAGMILNLGEENEDGEIDAGQTRRTLVSIRSELKRRETIFNRFHVNHIDDYMRLYREGKATEALPHLIIISDEFAELKKEQPEFIKELVSTARVGRSIGVHLILATQKPAGVVDDQIFSNSRFKLCLRVQDKTDSNEMLKRPEAAYLSTTGRAYFQLGNNEIFEVFQSGYSGADYEPKDDVASADDEPVTMIRIDGRPAVREEKKKEKDSAVISQIDACIRYIIDVAGKNGIPSARPLWMPPLPKLLSYDDLLATDTVGSYAAASKAPGESILTPVGLIDDPERQSQYPLVLDFSAFSNLLIIGNQGCGKSTLIQTILYALSVSYGADLVNYYIFDFSSGMLKNFEELPHCGNVAFADDEEAVKRTVSFLMDVIEERGELFKKSGVGSFWEYKKISDEPLPLIIFVIDNYFAFAENYESMEDDIIKILRGGQRAGIQVVVSCNRMNDLRFRIRQNFMKCLPLQLNDRMDYTEAIGGNLYGFQTSIKGRGLCCEDAIYEFQAALAVDKDTEFERNRTLTQIFKKMAAESKVNVKGIAVIPKEELYTDYLDHFEPDRLKDYIPVGYEQSKVESYEISRKDLFCYLVSSIGKEGSDLFLQNVTSYANRNGEEVYFVNMRGKLPEGDLEAVYEKEDDIYHLLLLLKEEFTERNKLVKEWKGTHPDMADDPAAVYSNLRDQLTPMYILIDDFSDFLDIIYKDHDTGDWYPIMELFFEKGEGFGICFFAAMDVTGNPSAAYTTSYKNFTRKNRGIHMGGQLNLQRLFHFDLPISKQTVRFQDNIGCLIDGNESLSIYIPWAKEEDRK